MRVSQARRGERYGLRREELGRMTGFSLRALAEWSAGKIPSEPAKRRLHEIRRLLNSLAQVVKPEAFAPLAAGEQSRFQHTRSGCFRESLALKKLSSCWKMAATSFLISRD